MGLKFRGGCICSGANMHLSAIVESLLIASQQPLAADELARLIRSRVAELEDGKAREAEEGKEVVELAGWYKDLAAVGSELVEAAIVELNEHYDASGRAFKILERSNGWKIFTRAEYGEFVRQMFPGRKPERLSGPAMETLAIIAYRQPVTKAAIEAVRGVACDGMIQKLLDRDLIRIGGRADLPGRPLLYETTDLFFEHFGIRTIDDLPNSTELRRVKLPDGTESAPVGEEEQLAFSTLGAPAASAEQEESPKG